MAAKASAKSRGATQPATNADQWAKIKQDMVNGKATLGGVFGQDGNPWTPADARFKCTPEEIKKIVVAINKGNADEYSTSGITLNKEKWTVILLDADQKVLVMISKPGHTPKGKVVATLSKTGVIVGATIDDSVTSADVRLTVEKMRDRLLESQM